MCNKIISYNRQVQLYLKWINQHVIINETTIRYLIDKFVMVITYKYALDNDTIHFHCEDMHISWQNGMFIKAIDRHVKKGIEYMNL